MVSLSWSHSVASRRPVNPVCGGKSLWGATSFLCESLVPCLIKVIRWVPGICVRLCCCGSMFIKQHSNYAWIMYLKSPKIYFLRLAFQLLQLVSNDQINQQPKHCFLFLNRTLTINTFVLFLPTFVHFLRKGIFSLQLQNAQVSSFVIKNQSTEVLKICSRLLHFSSVLRKPSLHLRCSFLDKYT